MHNTTRRIATDAMLSAMFVCLSFISIRIGNSMKISVDSLPILVAALLLGPLDGLAVGLINRKKIIAEAKAEKEKAA